MPDDNDLFTAKLHGVADALRQVATDAGVVALIPAGAFLQWSHRILEKVSQVEENFNPPRAANPDD